MTRTAKLALAVMLFVGSLPVRAQTPSDYPWMSPDSQNVSTRTWSISQIGGFVTEVTNADDPLTVGDFLFADLLGDGSLELVASTDVSGRGFFNELLISRKNTSAFSVQRITVQNLESLAHVLADLDADGKLEIVVPVSLTPYLEGAVPQAKWTAIYTWTGALYEERTAAFAPWYAANVLHGLQQALAATQQGGDPVAIALAQIQLDKATRASGGSPDAGMTDAQALAVSNDPNLRIWAAFALADIGTPAALATLATLLRDPDPSVASYATSARDKNAQEHCDRVSITIQSGGPQHLVNLVSAKPVVVVVDLPTRGNASLAPKSVTFGATGIEQSLISCNHTIKGISCLFRASLTGLQVGDGVATLRAKRSDGRCVIGRDAVQVGISPARISE